MGYYTHHSLVVKPWDGVDHEQYISDKAGYQHCFDGEEIKWYNHDSDMRTYSKLYPDHLFTLTGEGEEAGDMWIEYYKNGKMQRCKGVITYAPYDESELE